MKKISSFDISKYELITSASGSRGNQPKWYSRKAGMWIKEDFTGYEALAEHIATRCLLGSNIKKYAKYDLGVINRMKGGKVIAYNSCRSKHFLKEDESLITVNRFFKSIGVDLDKHIEKMTIEKQLEYVINTIHKYTNITDFDDYLAKVLQYDSFTLNVDRHFDNLVVIVNDSGIYSSGYVFDNGASFMSDTKWDYPLGIDVKDLLKDVYSRPFSYNTLQQLNAVKNVCGYRLKLKYDSISKIDTTGYDIYTDEILSRVSELIKIQTEAHKDIIY